MALRSFGQVLVTTGGTPVRATANLTDLTQRVALQSVRVQVRPANTGLLYVIAGGNNFAGVDDRTARTRVLAILPAPSSATTGPFDAYEASLPNVPAGINLADLWLDVSVNGDGGIISGTGA